MMISLPDQDQEEAVPVDWEDIHDTLVVLHEETERLVHWDGNYSVQVPMALQ